LGEIGFAQKTVAAARALQYDERLGRGVSPFSACCCSTSTDRYYVAAGGVNAGLNKQDGWGRKVVCDFDQGTTNPIERAIEKKLVGENIGDPWCTTDLHFLQHE
jgi:hypothetical protein